MAWTTPSTWVSGAILTAAQLNTQLRDNLDAIGGAWTSYTPTLSNVAVGTGGSAENTGKYIKAGRLVIFRVKLVLGTSGASVSGSIGITVPSALAIANQQSASFSSVIYDVGAAVYSTICVQETTSRIDIYAVNSAGTYATIGTTSATVPHTWAAGDQIHLSGVYEAAA